MTEIKVTLSSPKIIATVTQGMNGKTAYQSAVTGGYTGTEAEFNTLMANVPSNATQVPFTPTGELSSTNVQTALAELDTEKASKTQEAWIAPTLLNGWVNFAGGYAPVGYYKDTLGIVRLKGLVSSGTLTVPIFVLPIGYRPQNNRRFAVIANDTIGFVEVYANGEVVMWNGTTPYVSLDNISFKAEQ